MLLFYIFTPESGGNSISPFSGNPSSLLRPFSPSSLISSTIYNETGTLKYSNAISGGYKLIETEIRTEVKDAEGNTMYDENGEIVYSISYEYAYSDSVIVPERAWNENGITKSEIVDDLKYIYSNTISVSSTSNELKIEDDMIYFRYKCGQLFEPPTLKNGLDKDLIKKYYKYNRNKNNWKNKNK